MFGSLSTEKQKELIKFALERDTTSVRRWHCTRLYMYKQLSNSLSDKDSTQKNCLCVSKSKPFAKLLGLKKSKLKEADYPEYDITDLPFDDGTFDFCVSDQVLEHVEGNPFAATQECLRVVKPGGIVVHTSCLINPVHAVPKDFWRFTPDALVLLHNSDGGEVIECSGWGNKEIWDYIALGFRWKKIPEDKDNPIYQLAMKQDKDWLIVTWIVYRKGEANPTDK